MGLGEYKGDVRLCAKGLTMPLTWIWGEKRKVCSSPWYPCEIPFNI